MGGEEPEMKIKLQQLSRLETSHLRATEVRDLNSPEIKCPCSAQVNKRAWANQNDFFHS